MRRLRAPAPAKTCRSGRRAPRGRGPSTARRPACFGSLRAPRGRRPGRARDGSRRPDRGSSTMAWRALEVNVEGARTPWNRRASTTSPPWRAQISQSADDQTASFSRAARASASRSTTSQRGPQLPISAATAAAWRPVTMPWAARRPRTSAPRPWRDDAEEQAPVREAVRLGADDLGRAAPRVAVAEQHDVLQSRRWASRAARPPSPTPGPRTRMGVPGGLSARARRRAASPRAIRPGAQ